MLRQSCIEYTEALPQPTAKLTSIAFAYRVASTFAAPWPGCESEAYRSNHVPFSKEKNCAPETFLQKSKQTSGVIVNLVHLLHVLLVLETDGQLSVPDASSIQIARAPAIHVNHPWLRKTRIVSLLERRIRANLACLNFVQGALALPRRSS